MPAEYQIDKNRRLVLTICSDVLTTADLLAHGDRLLQDPDFIPDFCHFLDLRLVTEVEITSEELRRLAQRSVFSPESRRALLASNDLTFGLSRMFGIHREMLGETGIRVFRDCEHDEALDWVLAKNTTD